jgi:predicted P-loop ATPase
MLETSEKGWPYSTIDNAAIILREDSLFKKHIRENMFRQRIELYGKMPWNRTGLDVTDRDEVHIRYYMEMMYHYSSERRVREALQIVATENQYHPVRDYLNSLTWDGNPRIRYALNHFLGAEISDYHEECLKLFLLGAISRVFKPGCKFEYMLCLVGGQGAGKSSFARFLAANDLWFTDDLKRLDDERVYERLVGHWICEMAEMIPILNTRFIESTKGFLSKQYDNYRVPYSVRAEDRPRQCVFIGTSNVVNFLPLDRSGNRRFLPIMCDEEKAEIHILEDEVASRLYMVQLWAEAMVIYREGKFKLKLPPEIEKNLVDYQRPFMQEDTWTGLIQEWLDHTENNLVCSYQIYNEALGEPGKPRNSVTREIGLIMNSSIKGWKPYPNPRSIPKYGKQRGWMRVETDSGNEAETFTPVDATQMEIPFD